MDSTGRPGLVIQGEPDQGEVIPLGATTTLGREPSNDISVAESSVSRTHAEIVETDEGFVLRDLGSTNGTYVNETQIPAEDYLLIDGDIIRLGTSSKSFVLRLSAFAESATAASPPMPESSPSPELVSPTMIGATLETPEVVAKAEPPTLLIQGGPDDGEVVELGRTTTLGRDPQNDLTIAEREVSRNHAEIVETDDGYCLRDLYSTNGTFVNRHRIPEGDYLLHDGDVINLGASARSLAIRLPGAVAVEAAPSTAEPAVVEPEAEPAVPHTAVTPEQLTADEEVEPALTPTGVIPLEAEPAAPPPPPTPVAPPTGLKGVLNKLGLDTSLKLRRGAAKEAPAPEVEPTPEEAAEAGLPMKVKITRTLIKLREQLPLLLRRPIVTLSIQSGVARAVVFQGNEVMAWGIADPREADPEERDSEMSRETRRIRALLEGVRAHRARGDGPAPLHFPGPPHGLARDRQALLE